MDKKKESDLRIVEAELERWGKSLSDLPKHFTVRSLLRLVNVSRTGKA